MKDNNARKSKSNSGYNQNQNNPSHSHSNSNLQLESYSSYSLMNNISNEKKLAQINKEKIQLTTTSAITANMIKNNQNAIQKIKQQQERYLQNQEKLKSLKIKLQQLKQSKEKKQQKLKMLSQQTAKVQLKKHFDSQSFQMLKQHIKSMKQKIKNSLLGISSSQQSQFQDDDVNVDQMTYQELLQLGQKIGKVSKGITLQQFQSLQRFKFKIDKSSSLQKQQSKLNHCLICHDQFQDNMECIKLKCVHTFHIECLKQWLDKEKICPLCKTQVL